jgi:hypothetical protein
MQVETSVALGAADPILELPWSSNDGSIRYYDLRSNPRLIDKVTETVQYPELRGFFLRMNAPDFPLQTVKTDVWITDELAPDEGIFGAALKFVSYVDLVYSDEASRFSFEAHDLLTRKLCTLLTKVPELSASVEFVIRHCLYQNQQLLKSKSSAAGSLGFCITAYVSGFGTDTEQARQRWSVAITLLQHAFVQVSFV